MRFSSIMLSAEAIACLESVRDANEVLDRVARIASDAYGVSADETKKMLAAREALGSTAFGGGIALPHARISGIDNIFGILICLAKSVDFDAHDDEPVDLFFALISPAAASARHLQSLAEVSRLLRDTDFVAKIRGASEPDAIYALLESSVEKRAA